MTKTILGVLCLIAVSSILFNNWSSAAYDAKDDPNLISWDENILQFSDLQGVPDTFPDDYVGDRGEFWAFTQPSSYYNWWPQITQNQPCMYTITAFDDNAYFDKSHSWVKSEHASDMSLLNHEQKHFDLSEIGVRKVNEIVATEFLGKQFACPSGQSQNDAINEKIAQDLKPIFDQNYKEMLQMTLDYDAQTNHGMDPQMQQEWDDYIANLLDYYESFKDKQEIQFIQEETEEQDFTTTCPTDYPYLHSDGQCWNVPEESQTPKTAKYIPYKNNQYGFSIKYPSTWQKDETLEIDDDKPNRVTIATFTSPSQTGFYMVGFAENDPTYKGLDDQQFLNKMKKEISNECKECQDTEFLSADTVTHKNGYKVYAAVLTTTMVSAEGTLNPLLTYALIPDGNDLWLIALMLFSSDDSEQLLDEVTPMGESFTIFDYEGTQQIDTDLDELDELNDKGLDLMHNEKYEEAISMFDEIIEKDPSYIYAYSNKGLVLENLERYDEALESFDKVLEIDPNSVIALYNKGLLLNDLERYREAIPYLDRALAVEPDAIDALTEKGYSLLSLENYEDAISYFDKVLLIEPGDLDALFYKGFSLADLGRYDEGISYYDLVLEQDPKDIVTLNNKGYALYRLGEYDEALVYLNDALDIDPDYKLAQENKDLVLEEISGKPEEGGCLIATATFGSELAPQVQFLREIRDNTILSTASGTSIMTAFNTFYYSFSPAVADLERQNPLFKETVKVAITPLLSSLSLLQYVDIDSETEMLGYGIGIILLNVGMYFVAPALIIFKIRNRK